MSQQSQPVEDSPNGGSKGKKRKTEKKTALKNAAKPEGPAKKKRKKKTPPPPPASSPAKAKKVKRMPIDTADVISKSQGPEESRANGCSNCDDAFDGGSFEAAAEVASNATDGDRADSDFRNANDADSPASVRRDCDNASDEYKPSSEAKKKKKKKKVDPDSRVIYFLQ